MTHSNKYTYVSVCKPKNKLNSKDVCCTLVVYDIDSILSFTKNYHSLGGLGYLAAKTLSSIGTGPFLLLVTHAQLLRTPVQLP